MLSKLLIEKIFRPGTGGVLQQGESSGAGEGIRTKKINNLKNIEFSGYILTYTPKDTPKAQRL
jgi:hypothetical protein